jgi:hypothetical protein
MGAGGRGVGRRRLPGRTPPRPARAGRGLGGCGMGLVGGQCANGERGAAVVRGAGEGEGVGGWWEPAARGEGAEEEGGLEGAHAAAAGGGWRRRGGRRVTFGGGGVLFLLLGSTCPQNARSRSSLKLVVCSNGRASVHQCVA